MSQHIERKFRNFATTPIFVGVAACVDDEGIVRDLHATGGTVNIEPAAAAEAQRMRDWLRDTFVGQHYFFFNAHNGVIPHARVAARDLKPEVRIVNTISPIKFDLDNPDVKRIADRIFGRLRSHKNAAAKAFAEAPDVGTYWQDRNRPKRKFRVVEKRECSGNHAHVRMLRTDNGGDGVYDWPYVDKEQWSKLFSPVEASGPFENPYAQMAAEMHNVSFKPARERRIGMPPELGMPFGNDERRFFVMPTDDAEKLVEEYRSRFPNIAEYFREFIGGVPFEGEEQPPAVGERYHSMISDKTYTVIDVRRKLHSTDYYVTMDRDDDKHRTKFTYRDHATWLSVWRPLDPDGKKHVKVEIAVDASNALRQVGEAAHRAAEAMVDYRETDAERQLRILYRELDRRVPGWRDSETPGVFVDELGLALRAIRTLNRMHGRKENDDLREQNKTLVATLEARTKEVDALKHERGGSWGPERIRTEQDRMREMIYEYARLFRIIHGTERLKTHMQAFGVTTMRELPQEVYVNFMRDCRAFAEKCMP
jgi:hypothetical protein